jgi:23S rRNA pseudouridine2604 synthase
MKSLKPRAPRSASKAPAAKKRTYGKPSAKFIPRPTRRNPLSAKPIEREGFPMRINKYLAMKGYSTRRGADMLVEKGLVTIDGKKAGLGDVVANEKTVVSVKGKTGEAENPNSDAYHYIALNKPAGIITHSPQDDDEKDIQAIVRADKELRKLNLFPVGRLDKASHGLIILTNDGRITDRMLSPDKPHEKEYSVKVQERPRPSFKEHMERGVTLEDGYVTKPCKVTMTGETIFRITLTEGKKHQIRRMVSAMHNTCIDIKRVRVMNIKLKELKPGEWREIKDKERSDFLISLGLPA